MHIRRLNQAIFDFPFEHPARRFLEAFIDCRRECVGRELEEIDQKWHSTSERRVMQFSSFAYEHLSFDVVLDGWLSQANDRTASEEAALAAIPHTQTLLHECREAAQADGNATIIQMCDQVHNVLMLWGECIQSRVVRK